MSEVAVSATSPGYDHTMDAIGSLRITPRTDLAVRFLLQIAAQGPGHEPMRCEDIASQQGVSPAYAMGVLLDLRRRGFVASQRGSRGGFRLVRAPEDIAVGEVVRAIGGSEASTVPVHRPSSAPPCTRNLDAVWAAVDSSVREVVDGVSLADVMSGRLPPAA